LAILSLKALDDLDVFLYSRSGCSSEDASGNVELAADDIEAVELSLEYDDFG
jgi:hypothetical protein